MAGKLNFIMNKIKQSIDGIYFNYEDNLNDEVFHKKSYDSIELFPKLKIIFNELGIDKSLFYLKNKSIAPKFYLNHENCFLKLQSKIQTPIIHNHKTLSIQLKNSYLSRHSFDDLKQFFYTTRPISTSKIECAFDFVADKKFLKETVKIFLNKNNYTNFEGSKTYINLEDDELTGLSYGNSSKVIKVYRKDLELQKNKMKMSLFYEKNPEFIGLENIYRIEIGFITSKRIKHLFKIEELFRSEEDFINIIKNQFFKEFKVFKKSQIKTIIDNL